MNSQPSRRHIHLVPTSSVLEETLLACVRKQWIFSFTTDPDAAHGASAPVRFQVLLSPPRDSLDTAVVLFGSPLLPHCTSSGRTVVLSEGPFGAVGCDPAPLMMFVGDDRDAVLYAHNSWERRRRAPQPLMVSLSKALHLNQSWTHHIPVAHCRKKNSNIGEEVILLRRAH
jgi:hypothetical protein